ncbi:PP2C family protein-serine/threonine phosphatase [Streptomyces sp. NPDC014846]|uniref:PP2C family protein-serine/threonine phosphatase n=1 Tax=Streptomyces sp. NPDC014846 TaxID=3364922 RepID=UPI0036FD37FC
MLVQERTHMPRARRAVGEAAYGATIGILVPLVALVVSAVLVLWAPSHTRFGPVFAAVPALAAATCTVTGIACTGLLTSLTSLLVAWLHGWLLDAPSLGTIICIVAVSLAAMWAGSVRLRREQELADVRLIAETAQRVVLRPVPERLGPVRLNGLYLAAHHRARIGGDAYECLETAFGVRVLIADIRGKGLPAVDAAAALLTCFREAAHTERSLDRLAKRLEDSTQRYARTAGAFSECFATAVVVEIPTEEVVRIVHFGHPRPLLLRSGCSVPLTPSVSGLPLGFGDLAQAGHQLVTRPFRLGDRILLYTDGVTECRADDGTFYPLLRRLQRWTGLTGAALLDTLREDLLRHGGGRRQDDAALILVERVDAAIPAPTARPAG